MKKLLHPLQLPLVAVILITQIPIVIYYADYIPQTVDDHLGQDNWRVRLKMAQMWVDKINQ